MYGMLRGHAVAARTPYAQANAKRDRDVATMRDDLAAIKTCEAAASRAAAERAAAAEEAARRSEAEAAGLRGKVKELEAQLRAARQELDKRRADSEVGGRRRCQGHQQAQRNAVAPCAVPGSTHDLTRCMDGALFLFCCILVSLWFLA